MYKYIIVISLFISSLYAFECHHVFTAECSLKEDRSLKFFVAFNVRHPCINEFDLTAKVFSVIDDKYSDYKKMCENQQDLQQLGIEEFSSAILALRERTRLVNECFTSSNRKNVCRNEMIRIRD